ncbi:FecR family protein, partial [Chitinophaga sp.]|uniref:FecR family protein n=1 Tax=Chitinophaga sp. TaxID=1869181 RepID=UPI002F93BB63
MSEKTFEALFNQYMSGSLPAADLRLFRSMAMLPENKARLSQLLQEAFTDPAFAEHADFNAEEMAREIMQKVRQNEAITPVIHREQLPLISRSWFKYAAAAAIFLLLLAGSWQWHARQQHPESLLVHQTLLQAPAAHPILILGDGSRISLDSAALGAIAQQGATQVLKLANGELAYHNAPGKESSVLFNTMQTPNGCQYQLTLPDGSKVWLNAASSIRYPTAFPADNRTVEVTGEAYFDIAKDENKPFTVAVKGMQVQVLGTTFNVMAYADEEVVKTTLVQGAVKINAQTLLHPGEQAVLHPSSGKVEVNTADLEETQGWKNGEFYFRETNIRS